MNLNKRLSIDKHASHLQSLALDLCFSVLDAFFKQLDERLLEEVEAAANQQQWPILTLAKTVQADKANLSQLFENEIMEGFVQFRLGRLGGENTEAEDRSTSLSLVATDELERDLAVNSIARRAETRHMESLYSLSQRLAVVNGGKKLAEDGNPLAPAQFAKGLNAIIIPLELSTNFLVLFSRVFEPILIQQLDSLYEKANAYLIEEGILPNLRYSVSKMQQSANTAVVDKKHVEVASEQQAGISDQYYQQAQEQVEQKMGRQAGGSSSSVGASNSVAQSGGISQNQGGTDESVRTPHSGNAPEPDGFGDAVYQQRMFNTIRQLQNNPSVAADGTGLEQNRSVSGSMTVAPSSHLVSVLNESPVKHKHADALAADHVPALTVEHYQSVAQHIQDEVGDDHCVDNDDSHTIDLVGMIFEYMLGDEVLPDSLKAVLSYLHTPFLKVALSDPKFFDSAEHPARQLLNLLADTGKRWVNSDGESQFKIFPKIKSIVRRTVMDQKGDIELYGELLTELQEFHVKTKHKIELLEKRTQEKVQGEERLRESKRRVYYEIKKRIGEQQLPAAVTVLLLHPWADFLTFELLRFGKSSEQWQQGLAMVDDILWSLLPKDAQDCSRLIVMQTEMKLVLTEAIKSISFNQSKALKLIAILGELQDYVLDQATTADSATFTEIDPAFEHSIEGGDEFIEEVYPEEQFEERDQSLYSEAEKELVEQLKHIDFGTQLEFDDLHGSERQRLKVAWYNLKTMRYMLVDNAGRQVTMTSGIEIARLILSEHARILSGTTKPFFERALENILLRLKGVHG